MPKPERHLLPSVIFTSISLMAGQSLANDWLPTTVSEVLRGRQGSVAVMIGGMFDNGGREYTGTLSAYCMGQATVVGIESKTLHFGQAPVRVQYALDAGPSQTMDWEGCADGACIGLWNGQSVSFLKALLGKRELKMSIDTPFAGTIHATFYIQGAKSGLEPIGQKCGWMDQTN
ncbi:MAG: hypothetical protein GEV13_17255 [Rhodospirillales bacterium]|nr:hypothetical protein [Rhodospirillales bacterium]